MCDDIEFITGAILYRSSSKPWKSDPGDPPLTDNEWDDARRGLRDWLSSQYLVRYTPRWQRHCWVEADMDPKGERTLTVTIAIADVLTTGFLDFVQQWLRTDAHRWRVAIPLDRLREDVIVVYPESIRMEGDSKFNANHLIDKSRLKLGRSISQGRKFYGIKDKPYPPIPTL